MTDDPNNPAPADLVERAALPVEAVHLPECQHSRAPIWLCECPRPIFALQRPALVDREAIARAFLRNWYDWDDDNEFDAVWHGTSKERACSAAIAVLDLLHPAQEGE